MYEKYFKQTFNRAKCFSFDAICNILQAQLYIREKSAKKCWEIAKVDTTTRDYRKPLKTVIANEEINSTVRNNIHLSRLTVAL